MGGGERLARSGEQSAGYSRHLPGPVRNPYYVVSPPYVRTSAGIKTLHLLCHALNRLGERAYLITHPYDLPEYAVNSDLLTPVLTQKAIEADFGRGLCPITIYPETIRGNLFAAPFVVRYVLNYPGLLGGDASFDDSEFCIVYSQSIHAAIGNARGTLFVPASDPSIFQPWPEVERRGSCFYAGKYRYFHGGELFDITRDSVEIHRVGPQTQTPEQIAELFRRSEVFYCYENSALAIEAVLCGCPVVFLPNRYFDRVIAAEEHGWDGMAWGTDRAELDRAKASVSLARERYLRLYDRFDTQLWQFVEATQTEARRRTYARPMRVPFVRMPGSVKRLVGAIRIIRSLVREQGIAWVMWRVARRILKGRLSLRP